MADKQPLQKSAEELDKEVDNFIDKMIDKNKDYNYKDGLTEENWEEEIEKIPLFMTKEPKEGEELSDGLAALQALKYEEENPEAKAQSYKEEGNYEYKKKNFKKAIIAYTEGIKAKCNDDNLNAVLYTNRATANFSIGNNRSALNDAKEARKFQSNYMKAIVRGASACMELKLYEDTMKWCDDGLAIEPENEPLLQLRKKSSAEQKKIERDRRKAATEKKKEVAEIEAILTAIDERKIKLEKKDKKKSKNIDDYDLDEEEEDIMSKFAQFGLESFHPSGARVQMDENKKLYWPVMFYYPEHKESDFIGAFCEEHSFIDHFKVMFEKDVAPWDDEAKYEPYMLEAYFDNPSNEHLCYVDSSTILKDVLTDSRFLVRQGTPSFIILVKGSSFRDEFLKHYTVDR